MAYIKCGHLCTFYFEHDKTLGITPFAWHSFKRETIIDLPYCRIIITPGWCLASKLHPLTPHEGDDHETECRQKEIAALPPPAG